MHPLKLSAEELALLCPDPEAEVVTQSNDYLLFVLFLLKDRQDPLQSTPSSFYHICSPFSEVGLLGEADTALLRVSLGDLGSSVANIGYIQRNPAEQFRGIGKRFHTKLVNLLGSRDFRAIALTPDYYTEAYWELLGYAPKGLQEAEKHTHQMPITSSPCSRTYRTSVCPRAAP